MPSRSYARFAWTVLAYDLAAVAWGAYVRASGSGAGCGRHWPLCNGEVVPRAAKVATLIEFSHRVTAGISVLLSVVLAVWAVRAFARGMLARRAAIASLVLGFAEALIGAALVLYELVAHDASGKRALSMSLHLVNTFFLLAAVAISAFAASNDVPRMKFRGQGIGLLSAVIGATLGMLVLGTSGAITALGDTLFPVHSLREGLAQELSPTAHLFVRLRIFHPVIATVTGVIVLTSAAAIRWLKPTRAVRLLSHSVAIAFVTQYFIGLANVALLAPVAMQLLHLLVADAVWLFLVLASVAGLDERALTSVADPRRDPHPPHPRGPRDRRGASDETAAAA